METIAQLILDNPQATDTEIADLYNAQAPTPKPSSPATYVTYTLIGTRRDLFGPDAGNLAGKLFDGLAAWAAAPDISAAAPGLPNPGYLSILHTRLSGATGLDLSDLAAPALLGLLATGVNPTHPPLLTADQAAALLSIGYDTVTSTTADAVAAERARINRQAAVATLMAPAMEYVNALNSAAADPTLPMPTFGGGA